MPPLLKRRGFPLCTSKALLSRRADWEVSYHCCNELSESFRSGAKLSSQYCLQLSLLQQNNKNKIEEEPSFGHNTACSYHCCNLEILEAIRKVMQEVTILLAVITVATKYDGDIEFTVNNKSQYCLQLSLLQLYGGIIWIGKLTVTILLAVITVATAGLQNPYPVWGFEVIFANQTNF